MVQNHVSIDNQVGLYTHIYRPPSLGHTAEDKFVMVNMSTFIGVSKDFDCTDKLDPNTDNNVKFA